MQTTRKLLLLSTVAMFVGATALVADAAPLRWKFKPGQALDYVLERTAEGKVAVMGAEFTFKMRMVFDTSWNVKSVEADGTGNVEQTVGRIQISMSSPLAGEVAYDSKSGKQPDAGPVWSLLEPVVGGMLGETFKVKISAAGVVSDIELPAKLTESFAKQRVGQNRQAGLGVGGNAFNERGIKELITRAVVLLPEGEDPQWSQSFENPIPFIGTQTTEITFASSGTEDVNGRKLQKIKTTTELLFEPEENPRAELEITEQEGSGVVLFDAEAGYMYEAHGEQRSAMEMSGPQELTQQVKESTSIRLGKSPDKPSSEPKGDSQAKPAS